jgi:hypothetical protein
MMPHEHYLKAEDILEELIERRENFDHADYSIEQGTVALQALTQRTLEAQVHATLAQVGTKVNVKTRTVEMEET